LYPFTVPREMHEVQESLGHEKDYSYDPPEYVRPSSVVTDPAIAFSMLNDSASYTLSSVENRRRLGAAEDVLGAARRGGAEHQGVFEATLGPQGSAERFAHDLETTTANLLGKKALKLRDAFDVDIIKQVAAPSWVQAVARLFSMRLRDSTTPKATFDGLDLYEKMACIFEFIYRDEDPFSSGKLHKAALHATKDLAKELEEVCEAPKSSSFTHMLLHWHHTPGNAETPANHGGEILQRLFDSGRNIREVTSSAVVLAADLAVSGSFAVSLKSPLRLAMCLTDLLAYPGDRRATLGATLQDPLACHTRASD
jgi:hypothetical protein